MTNSDCLFCKIARGEVPSKTVYQDDAVVAFEDINPVAPVHILIIPKEHIQSATDLNMGHAELLGGIFAAASRIATERGIATQGFRIVTNAGAFGGQAVPHLHFHLIGGHKLGAMG